MAAAASSEAAAKPPWRRVLYLDQPYPDNYVDKTFLDSVLKSTATQVFDLGTLVKDSAVVAMQLSVVAAYYIAYFHVYYGRISARVLIGIEALLLFCGWSLRRDVLRELPTLTVLRADTRQLLLLIGWLLCLSPVLATLTRTFSDDTICALTLSLFGAHLALYDYEYALNHSSVYSGSSSMNAAIFASVLLAARLPSTPHVFALMLLATQAFVLLPGEAHRIHHALTSPQHLLLVVLLVLVVATTLGLTVSRMLAGCYLLSLVMISGLCPWLLVHMQHSRSQIEGPWDTAVRAFLLSQSEDPERSQPGKR